MIEFGQFHLRYLNPKVAADIDLERTMLIEGLSGHLAQLGDGAGADRRQRADARRPVPQRTNYLKARVWMGAGPRAGEVIELDRVVTMFGRPDLHAAVIVRRPLGYYVTHVEGRRLPRVNGQAIGREARLLRHGDIVEAGDERLEFTLDGRRPR